MAGKKSTDPSARTISTPTLFAGSSSRFTGVTPCCRMVKPTVARWPATAGGRASSEPTAQPPADADEPEPNAATRTMRAAASRFMLVRHHGGRSGSPDGHGERERVGELIESLDAAQDVAVLPQQRVRRG